MGLFHSISAKTIVCPNCGATATNTENCEYCGSFLVQFIDKGVEFDHDKYSRELVKDVNNHPISEFLDFQLATSRQPGINGTRTLFSKAYIPREGEHTYTEDTIAFVLDGKYLSQFSIGVVTPEDVYEEDDDEQEEYYCTGVGGDGMCRTYNLPVIGVTSSDYVVAVIFVNYSKSAKVNSHRSQASRDLIMHSQIQKQRFLKCDVAKLMTHKAFDYPDYYFDIYFMNLGKDIHGVTSILLQLAHNNDQKRFDRLDDLDYIEAKVQTL